MRIAILIAFSLIPAACGSSKSTERSRDESAAMNTPPATEDTTPGAPLEPTPPPMPARVAYTDAEVMAITAALDGGEVELAKMAKPKTKAKAVKDFATMMATHHAESLKNGQKLATKLGVTPMTHPKVDALQSKVSSVKLELSDKKGAELDQAYIDSQVAMHADALALIDELLMDATAPELRDALTAARATVAMHLEKAQTIRSGLAAK